MSRGWRDEDDRVGRSITYSLCGAHVAELFDQVVYRTGHLRLDERDSPARAG